MMNAMRAYTKTILWIVVATFVGTIFFVWGMDFGHQEKNKELTSAAVVNKQAISYEEFGRLWENQVQRLSQNSQAPSEPELDALRLDLIQQLIDNQLLVQTAKKIGLTVFPEEVASQISSMRAFQENGVFSPDRYLGLLNQNRIAPQVFEAQQTTALALYKTDQFLRNLSVVTEDEIRAYYRSQHRRLKLAYVRFGWQAYAASVVMEQNEIRDYFDNHHSEFDKPEEIRASHILIKLPEGATEEQKLTAKLKLENIKADLSKGADFARLARQHSEDPGSKAQGGDLGFFKRGMMVPAFEQAALKLKEGALSEIVETQFGYHLIKKTGYRVEEKATLEQVLPRIRAKLIEDKARTLAQTAARTFRTGLQKQLELRTLAQTLDAKVFETGWVEKSGTLPSVANSSRLLAAAYSLPYRKASPELSSEDGTYFLQVEAEQFQPFDEKKYALEKDIFLEEYKTLKGNMIFQSFLADARKNATIINNIAKESASAQN
jgi:peptidyl-prolyl cis-trans isomerase D